MTNAVDFLRSKFNYSPEVGLILGSGLGAMAEKIENPTVVNYEDIPGFPLSTVEGHEGKLIAGDLGNKKVLTMQGRFHYYEGYDLETVTFPIRVMQSLGIRNLIITNAAGGINPDFAEGALMIIEDHINFMGQNPLRGMNKREFGVRFPDMSFAYSPELIELAENKAKELNIKINKGIYLAVSGPSYETPAEIRAFRILGADAVGMSTVPEVIVANHGKMRVLGISCITNMAAGMSGKALSHEEVMGTSEKIKNDFSKLIISILKVLR